MQKWNGNRNHGYPKLYLPKVLALGLLGTVFSHVFQAVVEGGHIVNSGQGVRNRSDTCSLEHFTASARPSRILFPSATATGTTWQPHEGHGAQAKKETCYFKPLRVCTELLLQDDCNFPNWYQ